MLGSPGADVFFLAVVLPVMACAGVAVVLAAVRWGARLAARVRG